MTLMWRSKQFLKLVYPKKQKKLLIIFLFNKVALQFQCHFSIFKSLSTYLKLIGFQKNIHQLPIKLSVLTMQLSV